VQVLPTFNVALATFSLAYPLSAKTHWIGILLPNTGRDGSVANFCFNSIFEFFNRIGQLRTFADAWPNQPRRAFKPF
jgi:hypothetical protein